MGMPHWAAQPCQCINYVSCHDNHTLFDRIALSASQATREDRIRMNNLAAAFSILAQGTPFFQAGEEMLRTKPDGKGGYDENSYRSSDRVNALKWGDLDQEEYRTNVEYYRGLLALRRTYPVLRLTNREAVLAAVIPVPMEEPKAAAYLLEDNLFIAFNASDRELEISLPAGVWNVHVYGNHAGTATISTTENVAKVAPISATVLTRSEM